MCKMPCLLCCRLAESPCGSPASLLHASGTVVTIVRPDITQTIVPGSVAMIPVSWQSAKFTISNIVQRCTARRQSNENKCGKLS